MHGPWIGEYFSDVMLVNGKIWPNSPGARGVPVPGTQRLQRPDHGSADLYADGRAAVPMVIIGTEGGLLPVNLYGSNGLVITPAERGRDLWLRRFPGGTLLMTKTILPGPVSTPALPRWGPRR